MKLILTFDECQSELKCTHCLYVCLLNESQESVMCVYLKFMHMISLNMNMFLIFPFSWHQGDMGPIGEMGLPGPTGLKVIPHTHR